MKQFSPSIATLIDALTVLPGVGQKTAQRMALYLMDKDPDGGQRLQQGLKQALDNVKYCSVCHALSESDPCHICHKDHRNNGQICIVETMMDLLTIENASIYQGKYFVLHGKISPLDGMTPEKLNLNQLAKHIQAAGISEVILALSSTVEGETTASYIRQMLQDQTIQVSRIGFGVPSGGEVEYLDQQTLTYAFTGRRLFE